MNLSSEQLSQVDEYVQNYVWPGLLGLGVLTCLICAFVLSCALHTSTESFLLGLSVSSLLCLCCEGARRIETFIGYKEAYQYAHGYLVAGHDWFWFTSCWLVIVMAWERVLVQCRRNRRRGPGGPQLGLCRPLQAGIATVLVYCVCFVAALPQFWEWEVKQVDEDDGPRLRSTHSKLKENPDYNTVYFWFKESITTFIPIPLMLLLLVLLCCSPGVDEDKEVDPTHPSLLSSQRSGSLLHRSRPPVTGAALYVSEIMCYILLTGPWTLFVLAPHLQDGLYPENQKELYELIRELLFLWFHLFFVIQLLIMCIHSGVFRRSCCCRSRTCCRCCDRDRVSSSNQYEQNGDMLLNTRHDYAQE